ncbi:MAG: hypothetical protein WCL56_11920 [Sediminibacterium sp.]
MVITWNGGNEIPYSYVHFDSKKNFDLLLFNNSGKIGEIENQNVPYDYYISEKTENKGEIFYHLSKYVTEHQLNYNYIGVIDDDIIFKISDFNYLFHIATLHQLDVFQPSIAKDSFFSHRRFVHRPGQMVTEIDWVEIMAPFYRQNLLLACQKYFLKTISGQGVDCYLMPVLQKLNNQNKTGIVHSVQIKHARPIRSHQRLYKNGLNNEQEIEIIRQEALSLVNLNENRSIFSSEFKRLVLKDGNPLFIQLEINFNKIICSMKNLILFFKEQSHY